MSVGNEQYQFARKFAAGELLSCKRGILRCFQDSFQFTLLSSPIRDTWILAYWQAHEKATELKMKERRTGSWLNGSRLSLLALGGSLAALTPVEVDVRSAGSFYCRHFCIWIHKERKIKKKSCKKYQKSWKLMVTDGHTISNRFEPFKLPPCKLR